jgi:hypothetical protein
MRFQLTAPWPTAQAVIEPGTFIDGNSPEWLGVIMPLTVLCMDQAAADQMRIWYGPDRIAELHLTAVRYAPGVTP